MENLVPGSSCEVTDPADRRLKQRDQVVCGCGDPKIDRVLAVLSAALAVLFLWDSDGQNGSLPWIE